MALIKQRDLTHRKREEAACAEERKSAYSVEKTM